MCGLVGLVTKSKHGFSSLEQDCFSNLLHIDQLRGEDSTGVIIVNNKGDVEVLKEACEASALMMYKEYGAEDWNALNKELFSRGRAALGHNRKATVGKIKVETAHPFIVKDDDDARFFFMHNGTLRQHHKLIENKTFEVDSEALANHICFVADDKEKLEEALALVDGAYACQWVDQEKGKLYLLRNKERPLWIAKIPDGYVWASEPGFIWAAAGRNRLKVEDMKEVPEHMLMSIDLNDPQQFEGVALTVKKAIPSTKAIGQGTGWTENNGKTGVTKGKFPNKVSKSFFKRLSRRLLYTSTTFWIDDYVERCYPEDNGEWLVWGDAAHLFNFPVQMTGVFKGTKEEVENCMGGMARAFITAMDYNVHEEQIIIKVEKIEPLVTKKGIPSETVH
jgi:predicted glutamine amidotransferase